MRPRPRHGRGIRQESSRDRESQNPDNPLKKFSCHLLTSFLEPGTICSSTLFHHRCVPTTWAGASRRPDTLACSLRTIPTRSLEERCAVHTGKRLSLAGRSGFLNRSAKKRNSSCPNAHQGAGVLRAPTLRHPCPACTSPGQNVATVPPISLSPLFDIVNC